MSEIVIKDAKGKVSKVHKNTLIDDLYELLHMDLKKAFIKREDFLNLIFPYYESYSHAKTPLNRSEFYNNAKMEDFRCCMPYIIDENASVLNDYGEKEKLEKIRRDSIREFIEICVSENYLAELKESLLYLLKNTDLHNDKVQMQKLIDFISNLQTPRKIDSLSEDKWVKEWVSAVYFYFYYAVTDIINMQMAHSMYPDIEKDLEEYNNNITLEYGVSGNPGMYQLISMANRENPNILALYEVGELWYYGKGPSGEISYQKAYEYYQKTCECQVDHPLARWSIAYMQFEYSIERAKRDSRYRVSEFDAAMPNGKKSAFWYESITQNAQVAYDNGCFAAANLLGKIVQAEEEKFPSARKGKYKNLSAKQLFKESADGGYVYGCNNYALCCLKEAETKENKEKIALIKEGLTYLEKSAVTGNPWAANKIAGYYFNGFSIDNTLIIDKDLEKAYNFYCYSLIMCRTENYYWPLINIVNKYWIDVDSNYYLAEPMDYIEDEVKYALANVSDEEQKSALERVAGILKKGI